MGVATATTRARVQAWHTHVALCDVPTAAVAVSLALTAAVAAGERTPARLLALALCCFAAASGASLLAAWLEQRSKRCVGRHLDSPPGAEVLAFGGILVAASQAAILFLGTGPALYLLAAAASYALLYRTWLWPRTPFSIVFAGAAASLVALAGWQTAASTFRPAALLLAAVIFLWIPTYLWSLSIVLEAEHRTSGLPSLAVVSGRERSAAAVFANTVGLVVASLVFAPRLGLLSAAIAAAAGAGLVTAALDLRARPGTASARRLSRLSVAYLLVLLAGIVLSSLS
ncbi:MAG TPA: UbiA family prenyltransferase [Gaiellaceae bacterium]